MNPEKHLLNSMDEEEATFLFAVRLTSASVLPMVLKSAIELDLLQLIKNNVSASASELAFQLQTNNPQAASVIDRILRFLATNNVVNCSLTMLPDGEVERRYSLAPVCKFLTRNEDGVSLAPVSLMLQDKVFMEPWYHLKDVVLEGGLSFGRAHGMHVFEYADMDPRFNKVFNQAMYAQSTIFMKRIIEIYKGFEGLKSLVDVGGGIGASLKMITSKYPSIEAINFDLPHVIQNAASLPGVKHVGGDMFVSVPKADAIFMKWICHDWSDADCHKLLKNCYEALPANGKVIIAERILPDDPNSGAAARSHSISADMIMLNACPGGKERTSKEFQNLAKQAGFKQLIQVCSAYDIWVMELYK